MLGCQRRARLPCNSGVITTALLFEQGINYPEPDKDLADPKHQFLVSALQTNDLARLRRILEENQSDSVLLSTEGLTNHLYDFDAGALQTFRDLTLDYEVVIFIVVREKEPWLRSYYKQLVLNPPIVEYNYATPLRYAAFCELPRVCRLTNTPTLEADLFAFFGAETVVAARYEEDWMATFLDLLGARSAREPELGRVHTSISDDLVELIRQVNALQLPAQERSDFLAFIQECFQTSHHTLKHRYQFTYVP